MYCIELGTKVVIRPAGYAKPVAVGTLEYRTDDDYMGVREESGHLYEWEIDWVRPA